MDKDEASAVLESIPEVKRIECKNYISNEMAVRLQEHMQQVFPGQKVIVLGDDLKMRIVEGVDA